MSGELTVLPDDEAQHLTRVLRLRAGAAIRVFDGRGREFDAAIEQASKHGVRARIGLAREAAAEPRVAVTLVQAVLKGDKMDAVVRDAVMMGVGTVLPIVTARSEATLASLARARRRERWQRVAISSAKQCGRAVVPPVLEPREFPGTWFVPGWHEAAGSCPPLMMVEPGARRATALADINQARPREAAVIVGPEGGWTPEEIERGAGVGNLITLGERTLRADAMPVVALAALFTLWKEL